MMSIPIPDDWGVHGSGVMLIVALLGGMAVQSALSDVQCISSAHCFDDIPSLHSVSDHMCCTPHCTEHVMQMAVCRGRLYVFITCT